MYLKLTIGAEENEVFDCKSSWRHSIEEICNIQTSEKD